MRAVWLLIPLLALAGCDRAAKEAPASTGALSIQKGEAPAAPEPTRPVGEKLAVMDSLPANEAPASVAAPAPSITAEANPPVEPADYPHGDPRYDASREPGEGMGYDRVSLRDCRRAERRGDPLGDSEACRDRLQQFEDGRQLVEDCREAASLGDPFASSRACRSALGR